MPALHPANPLTPGDVLAALNIVAARVPDRHITPDMTMAATWLTDLARFDRLHVLQAAMTWEGDRFPAVSTFIASVQDIARETLAAEQRRGQTGGACPACGGDELVAAGDTGEGTWHGTYRPCHMCNRAAYERWEAGHLAPDHDCGECKDIRAGRPARPARGQAA